MVSRSASDPGPVVVCVDDDPQVLRAVRRLLRREPVTLRTTERPETALRWLGEGNVQLLITDLRMPGMDGFDLIRVVEERFPETASLILTGHPDLAEPEGGPKLLTKPWNDVELKETIRSMVTVDRAVAVVRGRVLVVTSDHRLRDLVRSAVSPEHFEIVMAEPGGPHPPVEVVLLDADTQRGPLQVDDPESILIVLTEHPVAEQVHAWYEAGVAQVVRKPVARTFLSAILTNCVRQARSRRLEAEAHALDAERRSGESWTRKARRWVLSRVMAPAGSRTGRVRSLLGLTSLAMLIGVLMGAAVNGIGSLAPAILSPGDPVAERLLRLASQDQAVRRWYLQQQLDVARDLNVETRRHYEESRRDLRWDPLRPVYPGDQRR